MKIRNTQDVNPIPETWLSFDGQIAVPGGVPAQQLGDIFRYVLEAVACDQSGNAGGLRERRFNLRPAFVGPLGGTILVVVGARGHYPDSLAAAGKHEDPEHAGCQPNSRNVALV